MSDISVDHSSKINISLFKTQHELLNLWFPLLIIPTLACQLIFLGQNLDPVLDCLLVALAASIFMNATHIGFTYSSIFALPETGRWIEHKFGRRKNLYIILLIAFIVFSSWEAFSRGLFGGSVDQVNFWSLIYTKAFVAISLLHAYGQTLGLSMAYNYQIKQSKVISEENFALMRKCEILERWGVRGLFTISIATISGYLDQFRFEMLCGQFILALTIVFYIRRTPYFGTSHKFYFSLRYLIWPLALAFRTGALFLQAIHGIEYYFVGSKMGEASALKPTQRRRYVRLTFLALLLFFLFGIFDRSSIGTLLVMKYNFNPISVVLVTAVSDGLTWIHFIWDRYYFRFREEISRTTSRKLLLDSGK